MSTSEETNDIDIFPFEARFQEEVVDIFVSGLSARKDAMGETVNSYVKMYKKCKLNQSTGDMLNIWESFMASNKEDGERELSTCKHFWVAIDKLKQNVVGHIGVMMSSYDKNDSLIYHQKDLNPLNVCELVRMGVLEEYRQKRVGTLLFKTMENYALKKGMKQIVLSTLDQRTSACRFYEAMGFKLAYKSKLSLEETLGPGNWEDLFVVHYIKPLLGNVT